MMRARVSRWGNSLAIWLPKAAGESLRVREGEPIDLVIEGETLMIRAKRPYYMLEELVAAMRPEDEPESWTTSTLRQQVTSRCERSARPRRPGLGRLHAAVRARAVGAPAGAGDVAAHSITESSNLAVVCPITSNAAYGVEGGAAEWAGLSGAVLVDQVRSIDRGLADCGPPSSAADGRRRTSRSNAGCSVDRSVAPPRGLSTHPGKLLTPILRDELGRGHWGQSEVVERTSPLKPTFSKAVHESAESPGRTSKQRLVHEDRFVECSS